LNDGSGTFTDVVARAALEAPDNNIAGGLFEPCRARRGMVL